MKEYSFGIDKWQVESIFSPIRNKEQVIDLLMTSLKIMLIDEELGTKHVIGEVRLVVSKMSRLFFFSEDKYFSINFPFTVNEENEQLKFSSKEGIEVDNIIISEIISVIQPSNSHISTCVYEFTDPIMKISEIKDGFWPLVLSLLMFEDGYIRYDYDIRNASPCGKLHPVNHYDIFYSSGATFKIGLENRIRAENIVDFLSIESECHFISP